MPYVYANGANFYYEYHGESDKDLVILNNGIFMNTRSWIFQIPDMARHYRILCYDMRGQGRSDGLTAPYTIEEHAMDLVGIMDALGIKRCHMVGTSYGGEVNLALGIHYPDRCRCLVIIASVSHSETLTRGIVERWRQAALMGDGPLFYTLIHADIYSQGYIDANPKFMPMVRERYTELDLTQAVHLIETFQRFDVRRSLHRIDLPVCIVAAELDLLKPRHYSEYLHANIRNSEFHVVPNAAHAVVIERPTSLNSIVIGYLKRQIMVAQSDFTED